MAGVVARRSITRSQRNYAQGFPLAAVRQVETSKHADKEAPQQQGDILDHGYTEPRGFAITVGRAQAWRRPLSPSSQAQVTFRRSARRKSRR